ncbi:MAG: hypothetical protein SNJ56_01465 [Termitinemataceae bacterium]
MAESGKDGYNHRKHKFNRSQNKEKGQNNQSKPSGKVRFDKQRGTILERPQWEPPKLGQNQIPKTECPYCGKLVHELSSALSDPTSGNPVHFDCVLRHLAEQERLADGDIITYLGGGRFGIVQFTNPQDPSKFIIKRIIQWEDKDKRAPWRKTVADNFSLT